MDEQETYILNSILKMIIPPSNDGEMPCATDVDFVAYLTCEDLTSWIVDGLTKIEYESKKQYGCGFLKLKEFEKKQLIDILRTKFKEFFSNLTTHVINCYYQNDKVLKNIGIEHSPPFPGGFFIEEWDYNLLEPVFERGKIYRA